MIWVISTIIESILFCIVLFVGIVNNFDVTDAFSIVQIYRSERNERLFTHRFKDFDILYLLVLLFIQQSYHLIKIALESEVKIDAFLHRFGPNFALEFI